MFLPYLLHIATPILQVMRVQEKCNPMGEVALMSEGKHYTTWATRSEFWSGRWLEGKKLRWKQRLLVLHYICMWVEKSWKGLKSICGISVWSPNDLFGDGYVIFTHRCLKSVWVLSCSKLSMVWNIHIAVHNENSIIRVLLLLEEPFLVKGLPGVLLHTLLVVPFFSLSQCCNQ